MRDRSEPVPFNCPKKFLDEAPKAKSLETSTWALSELAALAPRLVKKNGH